MAARGYGKVIENYTLLRCPDRKIRFIPIPDQAQRETLSRQSAASDGRLIALQRDAARPFPYPFEVRRTR